MFRKSLAWVLVVLLAQSTIADNRPGIRGTVLHTPDTNTLLIRPDGQRKPVTIRLIGLLAPVKALREQDGQEPWGTLLIRPDGQRKPVTIRLIGLLAPVKALREQDGQEPWGTRAQQFLAVEAVREKVRVEFDVVKSEQGQSSLWGYVWLPTDDGEVMVNELLLKEGHAVLDTRVPNIQYVDRLRDAQRAAREGGKGIWNPDQPLPESPAEFATKLKTAEEKGPDVPTLAAWKAGCVVANGKTKKYHVPGGQYYESGKASKNAVFFATEADAKKAGYARSAR